MKKKSISLPDALTALFALSHANQKREEAKYYGGNPLTAAASSGAGWLLPAAAMGGLVSVGAGADLPGVARGSVRAGLYGAGVGAASGLAGNLIGNLQRSIEQRKQSAPTDTLEMNPLLSQVQTMMVPTGPSELGILADLHDARRMRRVEELSDLELVQAIRKQQELKATERIGMILQGGRERNLERRIAYEGDIASAGSDEISDDLLRALGAGTGEVNEDEKMKMSQMGQAQKRGVWRKLKDKSTFDGKVGEVRRTMPSVDNPEAFVASVEKDITGKTPMQNHRQKRSENPSDQPTRYTLDSFRGMTGMHERDMSDRALRRAMRRGTTVQLPNGNQARLIRSKSSPGERLRSAANTALLTGGVFGAVDTLAGGRTLKGLQSAGLGALLGGSLGAAFSPIRFTLGRPPVEVPKQSSAFLKDSGAISAKEALLYSALGALPFGLTTTLGLNANRRLEKPEYREGDLKGGALVGGAFGLGAGGSMSGSPRTALVSALGGAVVGSLGGLGGGALMRKIRRDRHEREQPLKQSSAYRQKISAGGDLRDLSLVGYDAPDSMSSMLIEEREPTGRDRLRRAGIGAGIGASVGGLGGLGAYGMYRGVREAAPDTIAPLRSSIGRRTLGAAGILAALGAGAGALYGRPTREAYDPDLGTELSEREERRGSSLLRALRPGDQEQNIAFGVGEELRGLRGFGRNNSPYGAYGIDLDEAATESPDVLSSLMG